MNRTRKLAVGLGVAVGLVTIGSAALAAEEKPAEAARPVVQIALLLDTSNSMDGLITQAKSQLWKIVNEFVTAERGGQRPEFQVALYEYGNNGLPAAQGYIRQVLPLTTDLDKVSQELFALKTNGGDEFCGQVIKVATEALNWSKSNEDLKVIYIAGNEPFTQGPVDYHVACKAAATKGIMVNTIHCGLDREGIDTGWRDGALLADGKYMNIDQNQRVVHIEAPQDAEIAHLGTELNGTYIAYGPQGGSGRESQTRQDANAASMEQGAAVQRAITKSSALYQNASWDLVDAVNSGKVKAQEVDSKQLPEAMQKMNPQERAAHIQKMTEQRKAIQSKIQKLNQERDQYVAEKQKAMAQTSQPSTLDAAIIKTVHEQAAARHFVFKASATGPAH